MFTTVRMPLSKLLMPPPSPPVLLEMVESTTVREPWSLTTAPRPSLALPLTTTRFSVRSPAFQMAPSLDP